jgi:hypothetical protein
MGAGMALAQTTITGTAGSGDSWNDLTNWDAGVPSGAIDAIVSGGVFAQVSNALTPAYSGSLTLNANSTLKMHCPGGGCGTGTTNAVEGASGITMNAGSEIQVNMNAGVNFPAITLLGDAKLSSIFGASDWEIDHFNAITGAHTLTLEHFNGHTINLNAANGFSEVILDTVDRWYLHANAAGSLGTGDVTINPRSDGRSASLFINADDAMADTATLTLNGSPGQGGFSGIGSDYVIMNADDSIAALHVYGVQQPEGTYTSSEAWLSGTGTLTVGSPYTAYCHGDGTATACPCGNTSTTGGCANSTGGGASLGMQGTPSVVAQSLVLTATGLPANRLGLFFQGNNAINSGLGISFGDGLRCTGGAARRLQIVTSDLNGATQTTVDIASRGQVAAGDVRRYQLWYSDPGSPCSANFNLSNAAEITWQA